MPPRTNADILPASETVMSKNVSRAGCNKLHVCQTKHSNRLCEGDAAGFRNKQKNRHQTKEISQRCLRKQAADPDLHIGVTLCSLQCTQSYIFATSSGGSSNMHCARCLSGLFTIQNTTGAIDETSRLVYLHGNWQKFYHLKFEYFRTTNPSAPPREHCIPVPTAKVA